MELLVFVSFNKNRKRVVPSLIRVSFVLIRAPPVFRSFSPYQALETGSVK
jgi:hypothetical protein